MANKLAIEFVKKLTEENVQSKGVTTSLDTETMAAVERLRAGRSVKATVKELILIGAAEVEEARKLNSSTK